MTEQEALKLLTLIKTSFPSFDLTEGVINLWTGFLTTHSDYENASTNLTEYILKERYAPTISDIVKTNENVAFKRRKQLSIQQDREDEERMRLAVPPPWKRLGITQKEFEEQLIAKMALGEGNE